MPAISINYGAKKYRCTYIRPYGKSSFHDIFNPIDDVNFGIVDKGYIEIGDEHVTFTGFVPTLGKHACCLWMPCILGMIVGCSGCIGALLQALLMLIAVKILPKTSFTVNKLAVVYPEHHDNIVECAAEHPNTKVMQHVVLKVRSDEDALEILDLLEEL